MNNEELIDVKTLRPFRRFIYTIGALPSSYLMSMTYEEQLIWFCNYLSQTVIPALNNNGLAIEELQAKYIELKDYIDNYFDNLDVQEEINNKLDEMVESGELENLISQYIQLATTYVYNSVAEMKEATNLVNGSFARTSGFYSYNDGGGAYYKIRTITNEDDVDEMFIIALNDTSLIAELIINDNILNVKQVGIKGLATEDVTTELTTIFNKGLNLYFPSGTYIVSSPLTLTSHKLYGDNTGDTIIKYAGDTHNELFNSYDLNNLEIKNIIFDLGSIKDRLKTSINLYHNTNVNIKNCEFKNGYGSHLRLNGSNGVNIENCNFHDITGDTSNMGNCIYCHPVKNLVIKNCRCNNVMEDFLYLDGDPESADGIVENIYVKDCYINNTGYENTQTSPNAIGINGDCENIFIVNNIFTNNINAIKTDTRYNTLPSNINIINNIINNNTQDGLTLKSNNNIISNNKISNCNQDGLYIKDSNNHILNNNIINNSGRQGLWCRNANYIHINDCICYDNHATGIVIGDAVNAPCNNVSLNNCDVYKTDNGTQITGIQILYGDNIKILSCKAYNNTVNYDINRNTTNFVSQLNPSFAKNNTKSLMYSNAIPTGGTYNVGDIVLYDTPSAGGYVGAVCVSAGSPGTWKQFGAISS